MSDEKRDSFNTYDGVAVAFLAIGVVFLITMDNKAIGLPFAVLGVTFAILASQRKRKGGGVEPEGGGPDGSA